MSCDLSGKMAIITGSTGGLGLDIAHELHRQGADVILSGRSRDKGEAAVKELGERAHYCEIDIRNDADIDRCIAVALGIADRIDILVNNACLYADSGLASTRAEWLRSLDINLVSGAIFAQKAAPHMTGGDGVIVNISSIGGKFGTAGRALYPAAKASVLQLTRNEAVQLAPQGIRVVAVSPAWTWSPALAALAGDQETADRVGARLHPLGRVGRGEEVARTVAFVCSRAASFITGVDIPVDGGFSILGPDQGQSPRYWFENS
jgi:NAD(P)-dependent dehydrogenase (short-subunit alcohol dehydrogenase family)